jgi:hypothetical protein
MDKMITYSAIAEYKKCKQAYYLRYVCGWKAKTQSAALTLGSAVHAWLEAYYTGADLPVMADPKAAAMCLGYAARYPRHNLELCEWQFEMPIRNPATARGLRGVRLAGKIDGYHDGYLIEHKTASQITGDYLAKLWTDTQLTTYCAALQTAGYPVRGVIYNVLVKPSIRQKKDETETEFSARVADWCLNTPEAYHREEIIIGEGETARAQADLWAVAQDIKQCKNWYRNTRNCYQVGWSCQFTPYCRSGNPLVLFNLFEQAPINEELK